MKKIIALFCAVVLFLLPAAAEPPSSLSVEPNVSPNSPSSPSVEPDIPPNSPSASSDDEENGAVQRVPSFVIDGQTVETPENAVTVDMNDLLLSLDEECESTECGENSEEKPLDGTTPFPENVQVAPNDISPAWEKERNRINEDLLSRERNTLRTPLNAEYVNGIFHYRFTEGVKYIIFTTPNRTSRIYLQPGEEIVGRPLLTNGENFALRRLKSKDQVVLAISSQVADDDASLDVATNQRIYHFTLISNASTATEVVKFLWPISDTQEDDDIVADDTDSLVVVPPITPPSSSNPTVLQPPLTRVEDLSFQRKIVPSELRFEFDVASPCGEEFECSEFDKSQIEKITPSFIYEDGEFVYFGYKEKKIPTRLPALFVRDKKGLYSPIPYTVNGQGALLMSRGGWNEVVLMLSEKRFLIIHNNNL